jgi:hypothetical protein
MTRKGSGVRIPHGPPSVLGLTRELTGSLDSSVWTFAPKACPDASKFEARSGLLEGSGLRAEELTDWPVSAGTGWRLERAGMGGSVETTVAITG